MKRDKKSMIVMACVMAVGVLLLVGGFFGNIMMGWFDSSVYPRWMTPLIVVGVALILISLLLEICFWFKLKKRIALPIVFVVFVVVPGIVLFNHIRTVLSVKMVDNGLYTMKNYECTQTQDLMEANISRVEDLESWVVKIHFFNLPIEVEEKNFGCAAFAAATAEGQHLFGRNFDYDETDMVLVYSHPKGSYASIGMADLTFFGIGATCDYPVNSLEGRFLMIAEPYVVMDGINEKGVGAGLSFWRGDDRQKTGGYHSGIKFP